MTGKIIGNPRFHKNSYDGKVELITENGAILLACDEIFSAKRPLRSSGCVLFIERKDPQTTIFWPISSILGSFVVSKDFHREKKKENNQ